MMMTRGAGEEEQEGGFIAVASGWHWGLGCIPKSPLADGLLWNLDDVGTRALTPWLEASCPIAGDPQAKSEW